VQADPVDAAFSNDPLPRTRYFAQPLHTDLSPLDDASDAAYASAHITPLIRRADLNRVHYGFTGAVSPATDLFATGGAGAGLGFQVGGYINYSISPGLQARMGAGFSRVDGGFTFIKHSTTEEYGFTSTRTEHFLSVHQLYAGYASAEIGLKRGGQLFCVGLQGQYLYGARGDIERMEYSQELQPVAMHVSEGVWIETIDMRKVSIEGTAGVSTRVTRRLELAARVHIPITRTLRQPAGTTFYQYQVRNHNMYPQVTLSYQLNQQ
jgi:hypothetical protein